MGFAKISGKPCQQCWSNFSKVSPLPESMAALKMIATQRLNNHRHDNVLICLTNIYVIIKCFIRFLKRENVGKDIENCSIRHANGVVSFGGVKRICEFCHGLGYNSEDGVSRINEYKHTHYLSYQMEKDKFTYNPKECLTDSPKHEYVIMVFIINQRN